jgi:hypothetical protein
VPRRPPEQRTWTDDPSAVEVELPRGDVTEGVVRVGETVRRPHGPSSYAVAHLLDHLADVGVVETTRFLGRDARGRDVLSYLHGDVAGASPERWASSDALLVSVARLVRRLHVAAADFDPDAVLFPGEGVVCHFDVTPQNVVVSGDEAVGLVDFDLTRRGDPVLDAYNTAMHWVPLGDPVDVYPHWVPVDQAGRLRLFADAYGLDATTRATLVDVGVEHARVVWHRMKERAERDGGGWARMWDEGVGDQIRRREAWLRAARARLTRALVDPAAG